MLAIAYQGDQNRNLLIVSRDSIWNADLFLLSLSKSFAHILLELPLLPAGKENHIYLQLRYFAASEQSGILGTIQAGNS